MDTFVFQELITILLSEKIYSLKIPMGYPKQVEYYKSIVIEKTQELNNLYSILAKEFDSEKQHNSLEKNKVEFEKFIDSDSKSLVYRFREYEIELLPFVSLELEYKIKLIEQRIKNIAEEINYSS